jgi:recombinational DNA repair protein RecT
MNSPERAAEANSTHASGDLNDRSDKEEEARKIRRLQVMMNMVMSVIGQDPNLTIEEASELVAGAKRAALNLFPDKELAYDLIYKPRLQRLMRERFRMQ